QPLSSTSQLLVVVLLVSLNPPMAEKGKSVTLKCHVEKFYPEVISIWWKRGTKCLDSQEPSKISRNPEGTFSAMSFYNYTSISEGLSENISCIVEHQCKEGHKVEIPLQICSKCPLPFQTNTGVFFIGE
uniref:Ig-like domain-containing protein n=1 Tax=Erpetoichthys calabaricus TaxID=27687 RepID=A0A8C4SWY6_ERPCA